VPSVPLTDIFRAMKWDGSPSAAVLAVILLVLPTLSACFESEEEQALAAYSDHDYAGARRLAGEIADGGNPRGHELLALMDAQGLGGPTDFAAAMAHIDRAIALDPTFTASHGVIEDYMTRSAESAWAAFESGEYERAKALAEPLATIGHADGEALTNLLITGGYVALDGSAMSWRAFLDQCSGGTRNDAIDDPEAAFEVECRDTAVVWDGVLVNRRDRTLYIKMDPGRRRALQDLVIALADDADPSMVERGRKIRFSGIVAARGDDSHPDQLLDGRILGPGLLTPEEIARDLELERQAVVGACRRLINTALRTDHAPQWTRDLRSRLTGKERRRLRFYSFIALNSPALAFDGNRDDGYRARLSGHATIQAHNDQTASTQDFVVDCEVVGDHRSKGRGETFGSVTFESLSEPRFDG
jgi:hypothetical protein